MRHVGCSEPSRDGTGGPHVHVSTVGEGPWWSRCRCSRVVSPPNLRKGRRPTLILRTQLSVRVHAIIGESGLLPPPGWCRSSGSAPPKWWGLTSTASFGQAFCAGDMQRYSPALLPPHKPPPEA